MLFCIPSCALFASHLHRGSAAWPLACSPAALHTTQLAATAAPLQLTTAASACTNYRRLCTFAAPNHNSTTTFRSRFAVAAPLHASAFAPRMRCSALHCPGCSPLHNIFVLRGLRHHLVPLTTRQLLLASITCMGAMAPAALQPHNRRCTTLCIFSPQLSLWSSNSL